MSIIEHNVNMHPIYILFYRISEQVIKQANHEVCTSVVKNVWDEVREQVRNKVGNQIKGQVNNGIKGI